MEEQQNVRPPTGTTVWNHSYYTGNSLSALHSLQQLQAGASSSSSVQMSASTRVSHGAAPSSSVSCPQVTLSAAHPQVQMDPPALPQVTFCQLRLLRLPRSSPLLLFWSVASLFTLHRRPSYQSPSHPWTPLCRRFHTVLPLRTFLRRRVLDQSPRYFLMRLCRRLYTALQLMMPLHNYRSRSSLSGASSPTIL